MRRFHASISLVLLLVASVAAGSSRPAGAATYTVSKTTDTNDGACDADCSLREAISAANLAPGFTVTVPAGIYNLNIVGANEDANASGDLDITANMTIIGAGAGNTIIDGVALDRVLHIRSGTVSISGLTVRNGSAIYGSYGSGGGIINSGTLTLTDVAVSGNTSSFGGGVANTGTLTLTSSTVSGNTAAGAYSDSAQGEGGGIYNAYGTVTVNNSTVRGNAAGGVYWFSPGGGGIFNELGTLTLVNSTVSGNTAGTGIVNLDANQTIQNSTISGNTGNTGYGGGGILNFSWTATATTTVVSSTIFENRNLTGRGDAIAGTVTLKNTIVASPTKGLGGDCYGSVTSLGHNIASDSSCVWAGSGDLNSTNPLLGPLTNNGGPTQTHAPLLGSSVIDAVPLAVCTDASGAPLAVDQRGTARPQGAACDIGAVESLPMDTTPPDTTIASGPPALTNTTNATFAFAGSEAGTFQCSLDGGAFVVCTSPKDFTGLAEGSHSFQVRAKDTAGNIDPTPASLTWTVDTTGPALTVPGNMTVEASSLNGAIVSFTASANDALDGVVVPICTPASGSTFALGSTTVICTATDAASNPSSAPFTVTVEDTTPPVLTLPAGITLDATGPLGAVVTFAVTATDVVTSSPTAVCTPGSGSMFAIGTTTVFCTATDAAGNTTAGAFDVYVNSASEQAQTLANFVTGVGPGASLLGKAQNLQAQIALGDTTAACDAIKVLLKEVSAQTGKKLTLLQAAAITTDASRIAAVLGC